jgi:hypothetical protein
MESKNKVYIVKTYKECQKTEDKKEYLLPIEEVEDKDIYKLKFKDGGYHYRLEENKDCIAFGDIDKVESYNKLIDILLEIQTFYDISFENSNDFCYTISQKDEGWGSHWSIPKIKTNFYSLKIQLERFQKKYGSNIDTCIYKNSLLRLPYQTVKEKKNKHTITNGLMIDFFIHNTKNYKRELFEDKKEEKIYNNKSNEQFLPNIALLNILESHFENYSDWCRICWIMKSLKYPFSIFDEYSRKFPKKYNSIECSKFWNSCKIAKSISEGILHSLAKKENPIEYSKLNNFYSFKEDVIPVKTIEMNKEYLTKDTNINLDDKECLISNKLNEFFSSDIKSFNIKSPYDTGKTQLVSRLIKVYEPRKILWLSYRKTLTSDIMGSFGGSFNFKDYQTSNCNEADRLIIQIESIGKLKPLDMFLDEEYEIPSYDLVIIDEIESILQQFNSVETMKGQSKNNFEFIEAIIKNSNKLITLDGDLSFRGFNYIKNFGSSINIINNVKKNIKNFEFTFSLNKFYLEMDKDLDENKKIVIVSQGSKKCNEINDKLKKEYPHLNVGIYTGISSDEDKKDLVNVKKEWVKLDVLIYSPTIESGVNFDINHFDKIYGIVGQGCNSQRAFCQMLSRVRKLTINKILVYAQNVNYYKGINPKCYYTFDEVKTSLITLDIIQIKEKVKDNKIIKKLSSYDINYCYNKVEDMLKENHLFYLSYLEFLLTNKGHSVIFNDDKVKNEENLYRIDKIDDILNTLDIDKKTFNELMIKQKSSNATKEEKMIINKYILRSNLGIDKLDKDILKLYDNTKIIKNIEYLIDKQNIKESNDNQTKETNKKVDIIKDIIDKLGFTLFSDATIRKDDFDEKIQNVIKTNEIFLNSNSSSVLFSTFRNNIKTTKQFLGFVNSILENYKLVITSNQKRIKKSEIKEDDTKLKEQVYSLKFIDGFDTINELIQYKINKGYKLFDTKKIRPTPNTDVYKHLILPKQEKNKLEYDSTDNYGLDFGIQ